MIDPRSIDPKSVDWSQVTHSCYLVHQRMQYDYPEPIDQLKHHLVVFPPRNHGDQRRLTYQLDVSSPDHEMTTRRDAFGNLVSPLAPGSVKKHDAFFGVSAGIGIENPLANGVFQPRPDLLPTPAGSRRGRKGRERPEGGALGRDSVAERSAES